MINDFIMIQESGASRKSISAMEREDKEEAKLEQLRKTDHALSIMKLKFHLGMGADESNPL
jgi:hypothetical protein